MEISEKGKFEKIKKILHGEDVKDITEEKNKLKFFMMLGAQ